MADRNLLVVAVLRWLLSPRHRFVVPYPTHLFDTFCRLVDRYILDPGDEVEHRALGATAEAIEDFALEMDRAGWPPVRVEGTARHALRSGAAGLYAVAVEDLLEGCFFLHASEIQAPRGHDVKYPLRTSPAIAAMRGVAVQGPRHVDVPG